MIGQLSLTHHQGQICGLKASIIMLMVAKWLEASVSCNCSILGVASVARGPILVHSSRHRLLGGKTECGESLVLICHLRLIAWNYLFYVRLRSVNIGTHFIDLVTHLR